MRLTGPQRRAMYRLHEASNPNGFFGVDLKTLAEALDTSPEGAGRTASSLVRRRLAVRYVSTLGGKRRTFYQAEDGYAMCPHGCGVLDNLEDARICPVCEDEWDMD